MSGSSKGMSRRGVLGASASLAAGAGLGLTPDIVLAQAGGETAPLPRPSQSVGAAEAAVAAHSDAILRISREVWELAEISTLEVQSFRVHLRELEAAGFTTVSTGTSGYPNAFVSEWTQGTDGPVIAYLPEYDALPGLGNAPEPRQTPAPSGNTSGHGCGHNMLGAGCTGAAIALKSMMEATGTPGTIRVFGCAAEETQGAKVFFVRDGLFDDVDAALAWHPAPFAGTGEISTSANAGIKVRFRGRTAHAGFSPWDGRSALKGAELFGIGLQFMREHVLPTTRIHYVYENAGVAPNVVPDFAQVWLKIRAATVPELLPVIDWARDVAAGAALMSQTEAEFELYHGVSELVPNGPMIGLAHAHMTARPPVWTDAEQAFARACQREMGLPEAGMFTSVLQPLGPTPVGGSSDLGDISKVTPLGVFGWPTVGLGISLHTWAVTASGGTSIGDRASLDTARILAGMGYDLMTDPDLRAAAQTDLAARVANAPYMPIVPPDRTGPIGLPDWLFKTGDDEVTSLDPA
jgi:aminobenzoyl-glutamate utilization protein B